MEPKQTMSNRAFLEHNTKLPNRCLSSSEMVSLCSVAASDFPYALLFDIASSKRLLTFNSLSELVLQAANASFLCIAVRADVLLEVEKYLPSSSSDSAVKLSQNFCRKSTIGDEVAHFLQQKRLSDTLHQKCSKELLRLLLESGFFKLTLSHETNDPGKLPWRLDRRSKWSSFLQENDSRGWANDGTRIFEERPAFCGPFIYHLLSCRWRIIFFICMWQMVDRVWKI